MSHIEYRAFETLRYQLPAALNTIVNPAGLVSPTAVHGNPFPSTVAVPSSDVKSRLSEADVFPFKDNVLRALVPAVTEIFNLYDRREFAEGVYNTAMGRASRLLTQVPARKSYMPDKIRRSHIMGVAYPFDE